MRRQVAAAFVVLACVTPAAAQSTGSDRPYQGLFGGGRSEGRGGQNLDLTTTLVQAYDDNLLAETGTVSPDAPVLSGHYTMLEAGTHYTWANRTVQFGTTTGSAWRYYSHLGEVQSLSHSLGLGLSANLPGRTGLSVNQTAAYSPSYLFGLFPEIGEPAPGDAAATAPNYAVSDLASYSYATRARLTHTLTRRIGVSAVAEYTKTDFLREESGRQDLAARSLRTELSRGVGRNTSIRTGYRYRAGEFGSIALGTDSTTEHGIEFGLDHTKVLSGTRRAEFKFSVGVSSADPPAERLVESGNARFYRVMGDASVAYPFGRRWQGHLAYRRGLEYIVDLTEPVFVDGFTASLDGFVSRRVDLRFGVGYSSGESAVLSTSSFDTYTAAMRGRVAISRTVAVQLEYLYYYYDFGGTGLVAPGLSPRLERNGIRAGLTLFMPAFRR